MKKGNWTMRTIGILLCLTMLLACLPLIAGAENTATVLWVGGVEVTGENAADIFGDGTVSYDAETNTLCLNDWNYEGEGYLYGSAVTEEGGSNERYSAVIYSEGSLNIQASGSNTLVNSFNDAQLRQYGDGVIVNGNVTFTGDGYLYLAGSYAVEANGSVAINGITVFTDTADDGIGAIGGSVTIENDALVEISAAGDGIYASGDVQIVDSTLVIYAGEDGIYSYDGSVNIASTEVHVSPYSPSLMGTRVTVSAGGTYGIFAYAGLTVDEKLTIASPNGGQVVELAGEGYTFSTIVAEDAVAKDIGIEPLACMVRIRGLSNNMAAKVPVGQSLNEAYCEMFGVEDFSDILNTEKEGYLFGGWYTDEACTDGNEFDFDMPVTEDITIYAKWIAVYTVTVEEAEGGDVFVSHELATEGETVVITPTPDEGREVDTVTVTDQEGNMVAVTANEDGTYSFAQPASNVSVQVKYKAIQTGDAGGEPEKEENRPSNPPTGDDSNMVLWITVLCISGGAIVLLAVVEGKRRKVKK